MTIMLTARERTALTLASEGFSNALIAAKLGVSIETTKGVLSAIYLKLGARNRAHAAVIALKLGLLPLDQSGIPLKLNRDGHTLACVAARTCPCRKATR